MYPFPASRSSQYPTRSRLAQSAWSAGTRRCHPATGADSPWPKWTSSSTTSPEPSTGGRFRGAAGSAALVFVGVNWLALDVAGFGRANVVIVLVWALVAWLLLREYRRLTATKAAETEERS